MSLPSYRALEAEEANTHGYYTNRSLIPRKQESKAFFQGTKHSSKEQKGKRIKKR